MHLFTSVPLDALSIVGPHGFRDLIVDSFGAHSPLRSEQYYFVRTWDQNTGQECFQVSIEAMSGSTTDQIRDHLVGVLGPLPELREVSLESTPSPLWNAGIEVSHSDEAAKHLYRNLCGALVQALATCESPVDVALLPVRLGIATAAGAARAGDERHSVQASFSDLLALRLFSFRSHYEGAKNARAMNAEALELRCESHYGRVRAEVLSCLRTYRETASDPLEGDGGGQWANEVEAALPRLRSLATEGRIVHQGATLDHSLHADDQRPSDFHAKMTPNMSRYLHKDPEVLAYRFVVSALYSLLYTAGYSLSQRYLMCYLASRANEENSGWTVEQLGSKFDELAAKLWP